MGFHDFEQWIVDGYTINYWNHLLVYLDLAGVYLVFLGIGLGALAEARQGRRSLQGNNQIANVLGASDARPD